MAKKKTIITTDRDSTTKTNAPSILVLDIETAPIEAFVWKIWEENVGLDQINEEWTILSYCAKWVGKKGLIYRDTSGDGAMHVRDDRALLHDLWALLDSADIVVAQNGTRFDIRKINARMMMEGLGPYSPMRVVDTLTVSKKYFGFTSNKLAWLSKHLTNTPKSDHRKFPGFELWTECLKDNPEAWREMEKYNKRDVIACEQLYFKLRPWIANHPNLGAYQTSTKRACPKCGSGKVQARGWSVLQSGKYQRFHCQSCGGWSRAKESVIDASQRKMQLV